MGKATKFGGLAISLLLLASTSNAATNSSFEKPTPHAPFATTFGKTLPPIGYVQFCGRGEDECRFSGGKIETTAATTEESTFVLAATAELHIANGWQCFAESCCERRVRCRLFK